MPTREELLARIDEHEALASGWKEFIVQQAAIDEEKDGGFTAVGAIAPARGKRHDQRQLREALRNEADVRVERIIEACNLGRQAIDNGDGTKAMFFEHQAAQERSIVEPMIADLRSRAEAKATGAIGGANSWKPRKK